MTESTLTHELILRCRDAMRFAVVKKHADRFSSGHPDISIDWSKVTSWLEVKFYNDAPFDAPSLQLLTCRRLEQQGFCYYVIYERRGDVLHTRIVEPSKLSEWQQSELVIDGFQHDWVAEFIRQTHVNVGRSQHCTSPLRTQTSPRNSISSRR